ncbi:MAG TPA: hypothetical protein VGN12_15665 [Pirellulales bacterium]|jgi:hypothetical protein
MRFTKNIALGQMIIGGLAIVLIIYLSAMYSASVRSSLDELDNIVGRGEKQITVTVDVFETASKMLVSLQKSVSPHESTLVALENSAKDISNLLDGWGKRVGDLHDLTGKVAKVCDNLQKELPIHVPTIDIQTAQHDFDVPTITVQKKDYAISYVSGIEVTPKEYSFNYPNGITVKKNHAGVPNGLDIKEKDFEFSAPKSISAEKKELAFSVPEQVSISNNKVSFKYPVKADITERVLMKDEKAVLITARDQLSEVGGNLDQSASLLKEMSALTGKQLTGSISAARANVAAAGTMFKELVDDRLPRFVAELKGQRDELQKSRQLFGILKGTLMPLTLLGLLIPLGVTLNGLALYRS